MTTPVVYNWQNMVCFSFHCERGKLGTGGSSERRLYCRGTGGRSESAHRARGRRVVSDASVVRVVVEAPAALSSLVRVVSCRWR